MESIQEVWTAVLDSLKKDDTISEVAYDMWISCIRPQTLEDNTFLAYVHSAFQKNTIEQQFKGKIEGALEKVFGFPLTLRILCDEASEITNAQKPTAITPEKYGFSFDNFVVGGANEFAYKAALAVAKNPANQYNPLFIYGDSGLGKTHLLRAIGNKVSKDNPELNVLYITGENFLNEFYRSVESKSMIDFHLKYREVDILLIDDIQFLAGKERVQEEFFHTFDSLLVDNKQVVLASDRPPKEINILDDRLRTRFESGLLTDIQLPDLETRILIIKQKAEEMDFHIPKEISEYIATQLKTNVRQLEGVVKKMRAQYLLTGDKPSISVAQSTIRVVKNDENTAITINQILDEVSRSTNISPEEIRSNRSTAPISKARQASTFVIRELTGLSLDAIGKELGGRDHSTMTYAYNQAIKKRKTDSSFKIMLEDIIKNLRAK